MNQLDLTSRPLRTSRSPRDNRILLWALLLGALLLPAGCRREPQAETRAVATFTPTVVPASAGSVAASGDTGAQPLTGTVELDGIPVLTTTLAAQLESALDAPVTTAAPAPTPVDAAALLAEGRRLYRIGDYGAAQPLLEAAVRQTTDNPQLLQQARFELARTLVASGQAAAALGLIEQLENAAAIPGAADAEYAARTLLLRARALEAQGDYDAAIQAWWQYLEGAPWMAEGIQPRVAAAQLALGNAEGAAAAFRLAAESAGDVSTRVGWLERVAQTWLDVGRPADAAAVYDEILAVAQNPGYRAQILYRAGNAWAAAGNNPVAIERWQASAAAAPATDEAYLSLVELVNREVPFDLYQRGYIDLMAAAFLPAIRAYEAYLAEADSTDARYAAAVHELGQAYLGAGDLAAASAQFDRVISDFPECACYGQAWIDKGRALVAAGDPAGARRVWRTFARDAAANALAPDALWYSGLNALNAGNRAEAATDFLALADAFPASERAPSALYSLGIGALRDNDGEQARALFARIQSAYPDYRPANVGYWLGRSLTALGRQAEAQAVWQAVVDRLPDLYYGILSAQALAGLPSTNAGVLANVETIAGAPSRLPGDDGSQAFAEQWLAQWEPFVGVANPAQLPADVAADADLVLGRTLLEADFRTEGLVALERLYQRYKDQPRVLYPLSLEFARLGAYRHSITSMVRLLQFSPAGLVENAPSWLQQFGWPLRFEELIASEARAHDMDPFLYFSMIRQESLFEDGARSWAAAQGLAQIIPDTARWVAERQGHPDWSNELIYRPHINVNFGAYYFDWVRDYLDGNAVSALVGYNAGPGNAETWRALAGADDAIYVEILGFSEPRLYVQLITENLYHYNRLYRGRFGG